MCNGYNIWKKFLWYQKARPRAVLKILKSSKWPIKSPDHTPAHIRANQINRLRHFRSSCSLPNGDGAPTLTIAHPLPAALSNYFFFLPAIKVSVFCHILHWERNILNTYGWNLKSDGKLTFSCTKKFFTFNKTDTDWRSARAERHGEEVVSVRNDFCENRPRKRPPSYTSFLLFINISCRCVVTNVDEQQEQVEL